MRICQRIYFKSRIKRNICEYKVSNPSGSQEYREIQKWEEGLIYVGITCHIWVHIIVSTVVQIILRYINGEMFQTESIWHMCDK